MSAPPKFATLPDAIAAYLAGRSRRWAEVDGHQVDLHAAAHPCAVSRPGADEPRARAQLLPASGRGGREVWDRSVARNIAAELSQAVEVLPELAPPTDPPPDASAYRCPWCSRAWDEVKP